MAATIVHDARAALPSAAGGSGRPPAVHYADLASRSREHEGGDLCERLCRWRSAKRSAGCRKPLKVSRSLLGFVAVLAVSCCCTAPREALTNSGKGLLLALADPAEQRSLSLVCHTCATEHSRLARSVEPNRLVGTGRPATMGWSQRSGSVASGGLAAYSPRTPTTCASCISAVSDRP